MSKRLSRFVLRIISVLSRTVPPPILESGFQRRITQQNSSEQVHSEHLSDFVRRFAFNQERSFPARSHGLCC